MKQKIFIYAILSFVSLFCCFTNVYGKAMEKKNIELAGVWTEIQRSVLDTSIRAFVENGMLIIQSSDKHLDIEVVILDASNQIVYERTVLAEDTGYISISLAKEYNILKLTNLYGDCLYGMISGN